ncbi:MAG TPA: FAD-dependent oxidoreductase, partial [Hyphomicrobiales bacterium]|nr:FAD-dependent oxidoreductase [Hyphomicrobiales bacterium]
MTVELTPDICVVGAGSGGLSVAAAAAMFGVSVVLVEKGKMGGDCLNYGCVPSKALIAASRAAAAIREAAHFGIDAGEPRVDFARVRAHVEATIAEIEPNDSEARFTGLGVKVIRAAARFQGPDVVVAGEHRIRARRFVVATGSSAALPPVPGLA